ncbi:MAG TPA: CPBP family intramembrane glutamic endopeptidase [Casimicrobiaceae bacterium]|jgi:hypothetical protein
MTRLDLLYLALIAIGLLIDHFALWPAFLRRSRVNPRAARSWLWPAWMILLWTLTGCGIVLWLYEERAFGTLGLVVPDGWRLPIAAALSLLLVVAYARTIAKISRVSDAKRIDLKKQFGEMAVVLPHTRSELGWFVALSLTAGFCEEFVFRGVLIWAFQPMLGWWGAAALSLLVFAIAHAYQGKRGILTTAVIGALLTLVVAISGSLLPAIVLHALVDIGQGFVAWMVLRETRREGDPVAA